MSVPGSQDSRALRPQHIALIGLVVVVVGGGSLLLSAESGRLMEGAIEWHEESPLRAVVQLLCLNFQFATDPPGEVKNYLLGLGSGLAILILSVTLLMRGRRDDLQDDSDTASVSGSTSDPPYLAEMDQERPAVHVAPLVASQVLLGLYLLWSFASSRWSTDPGLAVGGSILLAIQVLWAFGLGCGLNPAAAKIGSSVLIGIAALTAIIAVWYYHDRNPVLRAMFPFGNPNFLAACLIPGVVLGLTFIGEKLFNRNRSGRLRRIGLITLVVGAVAVCLWAFRLADSRGPGVGLVFGLLAVLFFVLRGRWKTVPVVLVLAATVVGWIYLSAAADASSPTGRDATLRFRMYAWKYAWSMFQEKPFVGHGQGGFVLHGDFHVIQDVLQDPLVFGARIAHAHNEWLEVMADLGSVGIVLMVASLLLAVRAGMLALVGLPSRRDRWALIGLMGALIGLCVEETFGVGLRVSGVPVLFFTVLGLTWAASAGGRSNLVARLCAGPGRRAAAGLVGVVIALSTLAIVQKDWRAARNSYLADERMREGEFDQAIELAGLSTARLNPQRALTHLFRLGEVHLLAARQVQERALDREHRALSKEPPDRRLLELAGQDLQLSEAYCMEGSHQLKELVSRCQGFINQGRLEYAINLTQARNVEALTRIRAALTLKRTDGDDRGSPPADSAPFIKYAADAIRRELLRQPFNPWVALDYVRVAGRDLSLPEIIDLLARPLRHQRMPREFVELLSTLASNPQFDPAFGVLVEEARKVLTGASSTEETDKGVGEWAPERLRLAAAISFMRGDYEAAARTLQLAVKGYESLAATAPLGAASAYVELADCLFFDQPTDPTPAIENTERAIAIAPHSREGRELRRAAKQRMVDYYLAAAQEDLAGQTLQDLAERNLADDVVRRRLALRYRQLCESLYLRANARGSAKLAEEMLSALRRWIQRSIELDPDDMIAHRLASELAVHAGDARAAADHLHKALEMGLAVEDARPFLQWAKEMMPDSQELDHLRRSLSPAGAPADVKE
ncbi:MAG: O-antigen ligase family protein [Planctomycetes bacterium]|nr:O-antigen ligase family protein [Planctomycetota bacterium]